MDASTGCVSGSIVILEARSLLGRDVDILWMVRALEPHVEGKTMEWRVGCNVLTLYAVVHLHHKRREQTSNTQLITPYLAPN